MHSASEQGFDSNLYHFSVEAVAKLSGTGLNALLAFNGKILACVIIFPQIITFPWEDDAVGGTYPPYCYG